MCLRWVSLNKNIDRIVIGIDNISQLKQNIKILNKKNKLKSHELIKKIQFRNIKILTQEIGNNFLIKFFYICLKIFALFHN